MILIVRYVINAKTLCFMKFFSLSVSVRKDLGQNVKKYRSIVGFLDIILLGRGLLLYVLILGTFVFMLATNPEGFVGESLETGWIFRFKNLNLNIRCNSNLEWRLNDCPFCIFQVSWWQHQNLTTTVTNTVQFWSYY